MGLTVTLEAGRAACLDTIDSFVRAVDGIDEYELLGASRCHGWSRLDVVTHVLAGWQEMLGGLVSPVDAEASVDAASYWPAFAAEYGDQDRITPLMAQRRRTATYLRPASATTQLREVAAALANGVEDLTDRRYRWQGHVFTAGDYLTIWAVENVVHHLDLLPDPSSTAPASGLSLARATVEALVGSALPADWTDERTVLVGTGRLPAPDELGELAGRLPALG
jgi:hypothetical protein